MRSKILNTPPNAKKWKEFRDNQLMEKSKLFEQNMMVENKVDSYYNQIIEQLQKITRSLNDDDAFALHEKLKGFFNKLI